MKLLKGLALLIIATGLTLQCSAPQQETKDYSDVPAWSKDAIWYQIFVERFRNGDPNNDPTLESIEGSWPDEKPETWTITPWTQQWFERDPWFKDLKENTWDYGIQCRRVGGDLQGVLDKLDYISDLGVNAIYFNPLNDSPSLHKFDAANYRHIDRHFGPDPHGDTKTMEAENPVDPSTWKFTSADKLFLQVVEECHKRNIRVIVDYSWNHTGLNFWAFRDVWEKGEASEFADWFYIKTFNDPNTNEDEFKWKGWAGNKNLPEIREEIIGDHDETIVHMIEGNIYAEAAKQHIFNVTRRWLDPNGDGDPSDGIDGYRLDVAAEVPMGFWREYRAVVRDVNPEAYLVGEIWWEEWPDKLLDPTPFLGEAFDAVMNYRWFRAARGLFAQTDDKRIPSEFVSEMNNLEAGIDPQYIGAMMNTGSSHDTPRMSTSLYNKNSYKYKAKKKDDINYKTNKPDAETMQIQKMLLMQQYSYFGAPHIWMGDEVGMWGEDDPNNRKPHVWADLTYEAETIDALEQPQPADEVKVDDELFAFYRKLNKIRKENPVLTNGSIEFIVADDENMTLAYVRNDETNEAVAVFNISKEEKIINLVDLKASEYYNLLNTKEEFKTEESKLTVTLAPQTGLLIKNK